MPNRHHVRIIAKARPYNEAQWQRLLTALVYVLHERRTAQTQQGGKAAPGGAP